MARTLPILGQAGMAALETAWKRKQPDWARQRLLVLRLIARHEQSAQEIAEVAGVSRATVFNYLALFQEGGLDRLLHRQREGGRQARMSPALQEELVEKLRTGEFRRARDVLKWLRGRMEKPPALKTLYYWLGKVGGVLKMPRKTHTQKDPAKVEAFRQETADRPKRSRRAAPGRVGPGRVPPARRGDRRAGQRPVAAAAAVPSGTQPGGATRRPGEGCHLQQNLPHVGKARSRHPDRTRTVAPQRPDHRRDAR